jgi:Spy/CpxP family protein refolding chaperone
MRKTTLALLTSLVAVACSDALAPTPDPALEEAALIAFSASLTSDPGSRYLGHLHRLPDELALSDAQRVQIRTLLEAFHQTTQADREALAAVGRQAREAAQAGKSREEVRAILSQGDAFRDRIHSAETKLREDIDAVLTAEQKAWLSSQDGRRCSPVSLTEQQRTQISALVAAFQEANSADLAAVRSALAQAREARRSGVSREEVAALLEAVRPAMERIRAATAQLAEDIDALLTPEQKAAGCFRVHGLPGRRG